MRHAAERRWQTFALSCVALAALIMPGAAPAQQPGRDSTELSIELVDPKVMRVCADPHNLPFSNEKLEGFENKLAELFARKLDKSLAYTWFPQATGFVRQTLGSHRCDVIMGFPQATIWCKAPIRITAPPMRSSSSPAATLKASTRSPTRV